MIKEKTINNISIKPLVNADSIEIDKIKGGKLFPEMYGVSFLCARRKSGKTSVLSEIIKRTTDKKTVVWIFCPTHRIDPSWIQIIEYLENKGNTINCFDSMIEGKTNLLDEIVTDLSNPPEIEKKKEMAVVPTTKVCFETPERKNINQRKKHQSISFFSTISQTN